MKSSDANHIEAVPDRITIRICRITAWIGKIKSWVCHITNTQNVVHSALVHFKHSQGSILKRFHGYCRVPTAQGKQGKWQQQNPCQGIWKFCQNTGNFVCSSCIFPESKGKGDFNICRKHFQFSLSQISLPIQFCVCNSHKSCKMSHGKFAVGQGKHREFENAI